MKNSTFIKSLLATSLAFFCTNMPVLAQDEVVEPSDSVETEQPQDSVETVKTVYQMVDHLTSGKTYVIGVMTEEGSWVAADAPMDFGFYYPSYGRVLCERSFQVTDDMQIIPDPEVYLPTFSVKGDENGMLLFSNGGKYLGINKPSTDDKDDKDKVDDKEDDKGQTMELTFLIDTTFVDGYYWDIAYDDALGGFTMKNKGTNATVGVDYDMMTSEIDGQVVITYIYRIAPYETLPEELKAPIYFFEQQEITETGIESAEMDQSKEPKMVYSLSGVLMGHSTEGLKPGVYVVKQGKSVQKIMVR